jgi:hypothetical protein
MITSKNKAIRMHDTQVHIKRKINIVKYCWYATSYRKPERSLFDEPRFVGQLKKGKVHCSCPMCSAKTKTHGMTHNDKVRAIKNTDNNIIIHRGDWHLPDFGTEYNSEVRRHVN